MSDVDAKELDRLLQQAFDTASKLYQERGFQRRVGFGKRPALVSVDLANAWTRPGNPFTCDQEKMDNEIIPGMQKLLKAFRAKGLPVVHVTTAYEITDRNAPFTDMGLWHDKIPVDVVNLKDKDLWAIDSRIAPVEGEYTLLKKRASSFHGTELAGILRAMHAWGWRVPFLIAAPLGLVALYIRHQLDESPLFRRVMEQPSAPHTPLMETLRQQWRPMLRLGAYISLTALSFYIFSTYMTTFLRSVVQMNPAQVLLSASTPASGASAWQASAGLIGWLLFGGVACATALRGATVLSSTTSRRS